VEIVLVTRIEAEQKGIVFHLFVVDVSRVLDLIALGIAWEVELKAGHFKDPDKFGGGVVAKEVEIGEELDDSVDVVRRVAGFVGYVGQGEVVEAEWISAWSGVEIVSYGLCPWVSADGSPG
jgi:hypothetical protein